MLTPTSVAAFKEATNSATTPPPTAQPDLVNHPPHYTFGKFEVIDVLMDWFSANPLLWQTVKYIARAAHKGDYYQDLLKAQFYLNKEIENQRVEKK